MRCPVTPHHRLQVPAVHAMSLRRSTRNLATVAMTSGYFSRSMKAEQAGDSQIKRRKIEIEVEHEDNITVKDEDTTVVIPKEDPQETVRPKEEPAEPVLPKLEEPKLEMPNDEEPQTTANAPKNWPGIYRHVKRMRSKIIAPVDTMGCAEIPWTLNTDIKLTPEGYRFQLLVSLMLSSQTKDEINFKAMKRMKEHFQANGFPEGLSVNAIRFVEEKKLDELIFSVGFHSRKAKYIKQVAEILASQYENDIPNTLEGLIALPGVGPKMAYLTLQKAWGRNIGIGVDVHVDRLAKMWRWVDPKKSKTPEHTRAELQSWMPSQYWNEINPMLVGFGQVICQPRGRRCDLCTLSKTKLCSNVDRALLKKTGSMSAEELELKNKVLRGDVSMLRDIEDLA